jgi:transcriptional regulator with XRE-family HTH domain
VECARLLRDILGIDQTALSKETGIARQTLSLYENGHVFPSRPVCKRISEGLVNIAMKRLADSLASIEKERNQSPPGEGDPKAPQP